METGKSLNAKIRVKIGVPIYRIFLVTVANADFGSLKCYLLFHNKCLCYKLANLNIIR